MHCHDSPSLSTLGTFAAVSAGMMGNIAGRNVPQASILASPSCHHSKTSDLARGEGACPKALHAMLASSPNQLLPDKAEQ